MHRSVSRTLARLTAALAALALLSALAGCISPEAQRTRGGGPGADPGNRGATVQIHSPKENPYVDTPVYAPPGVRR